jgi:hypothetical protein
LIQSSAVRFIIAARRASAPRHPFPIPTRLQVAGLKYRVKVAINGGAQEAIVTA